MRERVVFKYYLDLEPEQTVLMPLDAEILFVADQGGNLCLWAEVDESAPKKHRRIAIIGTGHPFIEPSHFVHITSLLRDPFVWHVFDGGFAA